MTFFSVVAKRSRERGGWLFHIPIIIWYFFSIYPIQVCRAGKMKNEITFNENGTAAEFIQSLSIFVVNFSQTHILDHEKILSKFFIYVRIIYIYNNSVISARFSGM